jgi:hypothetical protein
MEIVAVPLVDFVEENDGFRHNVKGGESVKIVENEEDKNSKKAKKAPKGVALARTY